MKVIEYAGAFAGDKDAAAELREKYVRPALVKGGTAVLDFSGVELATQSFIHALIAAIVRESPSNLERIEFKECNDSIRSLVEIVVEYAQDEFE